ncbi:unknown [Acidaminococcus sp. CAG:917]|nr:unknown [Acidaminococcus sp. CAG:917]
MKNSLFIGVALGAMATSYLVCRNEMKQSREKSFIRKIERLFD